MIEEHTVDEGVALLPSRRSAMCMPLHKRMDTFKYLHDVLVNYMLNYIFFLILALKASLQHF